METRKGEKYGQEPDAYETTDYVIEKIEPNESLRGTVTERESSEYMSLIENKEPENVYQKSQFPGTNVGQGHSKGGDQ